MHVIEQLRKRLELTQAEFGIAVGVSQGMVSNYERGADPSPDTARKIVAFARSRGVPFTIDQLYLQPPVVDVAAAAGRAA